MMGGLPPWAASVLAPVQMVVDRVAPIAEVPRLPEQVPVEWLEQVLQLPAGSIAKTAIRDVDHGTTVRVRMEVVGPHGNESLFIKHTPVRAPARMFNLIAGLCRNEVRFYRHLAAEVDSAPTAVAAAFDQLTGRSIVILPDLRDDGFAFPSMTDGCDAERAALAIEALALLHQKYWQPANAARASSFRGNTIHGIATPLLCLYLGRNPGRLADMVPDELAAQLPILSKRAKDIGRLLNSFDQTLIHNDTHVGNMAFRGDRATLIDWQVCSLGVALKDVGYFMATSVNPDVRRACERDLLAHYLDVLGAGGRARPAWDDAWRAYRILVLTGYIAAAATALFGDRLQEPVNAHTGMRRAVAALTDLDSLPALTYALDNR